MHNLRRYSLIFLILIVRCTSVTNAATFNELSENHGGGCVCQQTCDRGNSEETLDKLKDLMTGMTSQLQALEDQVIQLSKRGGYGKNQYPPTGTHVLHYNSSAGTYKLTFQQAKILCTQHDAVLATPAQLETAWSYGMNVCACGWLNDGSSRYPIQWKRDGCGGKDTLPGITTCAAPGHTGRTWDVYCYKPL